MSMNTGRMADETSSVHSETAFSHFLEDVSTLSNDDKSSHEYHIKEVLEELRLIIVEMSSGTSSVALIKEVSPGKYLAGR
jgi:hypothetical protein